MKINGIDYPVIGETKSLVTGTMVPILDIPMMSDERWKELTSTPEQIELRRKRELEKAGDLNG